MSINKAVYFKPKQNKFLALLEALRKAKKAKKTTDIANYTPVSETTGKVNETVTLTPTSDYIPSGTVNITDKPKTISVDLPETEGLIKGTKAYADALYKHKDGSIIHLSDRRYEVKHGTFYRLKEEDDSKKSNT